MSKPKRFGNDSFRCPQLAEEGSRGEERDIKRIWLGSRKGKELLGIFERQAENFVVLKGTTSSHKFQYLDDNQGKQFPEEST